MKNLTKKQLQEEIESLTSTLQHLQADFDNYRKRTDNEKQIFVKTACKDVVVELLPVLDNFELALKHTSEKEDFVKGIELVYVQLLEIMNKLGLESIKSLGEKFNPEIHEALMKEECKEKSGIIVEEFQKGYKIHNKIIRPAKVKVAK